MADSLPALGFYYYNTVYTDTMGYYSDTVPYPGMTSTFIVGTNDLGSPYAWHSQSYTVSSSGNVLTYNFSIACPDSTGSSTDTIHTTIHGWLYDCNGNLQTNTPMYFATDSAYGVYNYTMTYTDAINGYYNVDIHYSGAATLPFPVYIYVDNTPYAGTTVDTVWVSDTSTITHSMYTACPPFPCTASFWTYADSTGMLGSDTLYLILNYTSANPAATSVTWDFGDGTTSTDLYTVHAYAATGVYNVCVTVTNPLDSCTTTYCDSITYVTRSGGFVLVTMPQWAMGMKKPAEEFSFNVYPNPANTVLNVQSNTQVGSVRVLDMSGRQVMYQQYAAASNNISLDVNALENGAYLLQLFNHNNELLHTHNVLKH
jgi:hypothetical protein